MVDARGPWVGGKFTGALLLCEVKVGLPDRGGVMTWEGLRWPLARGLARKSLKSLWEAAGLSSVMATYCWVISFPTFSQVGGC